MARKPHKSPKTSQHDPLFDNFNLEAKGSGTQAEARLDWEAGKNLVLTGYAGTGKTYLALALALQAMMAGEVRHIHIVRSAVSSRDIGHLPGTEAQKLEVYERAIKSNFNKILKRADAYECLKLKGAVSFGSTSFERGVTYDKTCIIVDEFQNASFAELDTVVTRLGNDSRIIFCGDTRQTDLSPGKSGFHRFVRIADACGKFFIRHEFGIEDIVRSGLVKAWIIAAEDDAIKNNPT
ncbi:hypothetical protein [Xanthomonas phage X1]|nr:hypothetical protein [Xanthomonas phage X1]